MVEGQGARGVSLRSRPVEREFSVIGTKRPAGNWPATGDAGKIAKRLMGRLPAS